MRKRIGDGANLLGAQDAGAGTDGPAEAGPSHVDITWMSISNIYYELGPLGVLTDGYITRVPASNFFGGGGGLARLAVVRARPRSRGGSSGGSGRA